VQPLVDAEDGAHRHVAVDVRRAVQRVEHDHVLPRQPRVHDQCLGILYASRRTSPATTGEHGNPGGRECKCTTLRPVQPMPDVEVRARTRGSHHGRGAAHFVRESTWQNKAMFGGKRTPPYLLGHQDAGLASVREQVDEVVVRHHVQLLLLLALHVRDALSSTTIRTNNEKSTVRTTSRCAH
jgi:hypothetical protein